MFPIGDDDSQRRSFPVVTYALIGLNALVFLLELGGGDQFIEKWAFIPSRFSADPFGQAATIFTAMFMHGGWLHLGGNMLYLWIFGDNVEDQFGQYLLAGIAATSRNMPSPRNRAYLMSGLPVRSAGCSALIS